MNFWETNNGFNAIDKLVRAIDDLAKEVKELVVEVKELKEIVEGK